jgi:hypothetical protein
VDAYALRLVVGRTLYGCDRVVAGSPALASLVPGARLLVHPLDRDGIGVSDGESVRATTGRASVDLPVYGDPGTPRGVAFLALNQRGLGASDLLDLEQPVTDVRVETLR